MRASLWFLLGLLGAGPLLLPGPAARAQANGDTRVQLERVEEALGDSTRAVETLQEERARQITYLEGLRQDMAQAVSRQRQLEQQLLRLEAELSSTEEQQDRLLNRLDTRSQRQAEVVGTLRRLNQVPRQALLARRGAPEDAVRTAILLRAIVPAIEREGDTLRNDLTQLAVLRTRLIEARQQQAALQGDLQAERQRLQALLDERSQLLDVTDEALTQARERQRALAEQVEDLDGLVAGLAEPLPGTGDPVPRPPLKPPEDQTRGIAVGADDGTSLQLDDDALVQPIGGSILRHYGDPDPVTGDAKGLTFEARALATVVAPRAGRIAYADRFRGYGNLLIIDHGGSYHSILAGVGRFSVTPDQTVVAGEPIAEMPASRSGAASLYFEYQRDREPFDPFPHLARTEDGEDTD